MNAFAAQKYKALCLLLYDNRKWFFGNAVSLMERGTPSSDNQERFSLVS
jgi:hypothetical protein